MIQSKDKELLKRLLLSAIVLHGDKINSGELTNILDDLVNSHDLYASFEGKVVNWNIEEDSKIRQESFLTIARRVIDQTDDMINITLSPKCNACEGPLKKKSSTNMEYVFHCDDCKIDFWFKVTHGGEVVNPNIDE